VQPIVPLGSKRSITVYDRVVVGSDGTPTSLYAVDRAAEVADAAQAKLVVVTAYNVGDPNTTPRPSEGCTAIYTVPRLLARPWRSRSPV
jgi:maltose/moltooligosaccharide transporter